MIRGLKNCTRWHRQTDRPTNKETHRQTEGHGDSMTESAQWGRFSEKIEEKHAYREHSPFSFMCDSRVPILGNAYYRNTEIQVTEIPKCKLQK